jgi:hypothetical protein
MELLRRQPALRQRLRVGLIHRKPIEPGAADEELDAAAAVHDFFIDRESASGKLLSE